MKAVERNTELEDLAERIKVAREDARMSQRELGTAIGVSDKSISAYEQGRSIPPFEKLRKIAEKTKHPITYFTEDDNDTSVIVSKLGMIEKELTEIRALLKKTS